MLKEEGIVREVRNGTLLVEVERHEACGHCGARSVCFPVGGVQQVVAENLDGASVGERVELRLERGGVVHASLAIYGLPLVGLLLGLVLGYGVGLWQEIGPDLPSAIGAMFGLGLSLLALRRLDRHLARKGRFRVTAVRISSCSKKSLPEKS